MLWWGHFKIICFQNVNLENPFEIPLKDFMGYISFMNNCFCFSLHLGFPYLNRLFLYQTFLPYETVAKKFPLLGEERRLECDLNVCNKWAGLKNYRIVLFYIQFLKRDGLRIFIMSLLENRLSELQNNCNIILLFLTSDWFKKPKLLFAHWQVS